MYYIDIDRNGSFYFTEEILTKRFNLATGVDNTTLFLAHQ